MLLFFRHLKIPTGTVCVFSVRWAESHCGLKPRRVTISCLFHYIDGMLTVWGTYVEMFFSCLSQTEQRWVTCSCLLLPYRCTNIFKAWLAKKPAATLFTKATYGVATWRETKLTRLRYWLILAVFALPLIRAVGRLLGVGIVGSEEDILTYCSWKVVDGFSHKKWIIFLLWLPHNCR